MAWVGWGPVNTEGLSDQLSGKVEMVLHACFVWLSFLLKRDGLSAL